MFEKGFAWLETKLRTFQIQIASKVGYTDQGWRERAQLSPHSGAAFA